MPRAIEATPQEKPGRTTPAARPPAGHVVLQSVDGGAYRSLSQKTTTRAERFALGRRLRQEVPRNALGDWAAPAGRPDPVQQIIQSHNGRVKSLIPVRVGRMVASPYGFLRGTPNVMASDFATLPATGITPVICGDAHMGNFGFYASPERDLVIDLNDFDEAHPGPWEWDLRRLATSVWVAGRQIGATEAQCQAAVANCVASYRGEINYMAMQPLLARSYERLDVDRLQESAAGESLRNEIARAARRARSSTSDRALPRLTVQKGGRRQIADKPPLITRVAPALVAKIAKGLDDYLDTLAPQWHRALGGYTLVDVAHKVVGVGSVGLRAYVALLEGSSADDVVFLQIKQARRSVVAPFVHGTSAWHAHQGQRVVEYQQALQTVSDPLLGWTSIGGLQYYVRQFRDMKGGVTLEAMDAAALADYSGIVGHLLAKGHARTSGASMIAAYVGTSDKLDVALCRFARAYSDQTEADHRKLVKAVARGVLPCEPGV